MYNLKPLAGKYFCEILGELKQTLSGLFIAKTNKEIPRRARVLAAGKDSIDAKGRIVKQSADVGDVIHFKRIWNRESKNSFAKTIIVKEDEIIGVEKC